MSQQDQDSEVATVFAEMQIEVLALLVARGIVAAGDAETLLHSAATRLSQAPVQGETTRAAMLGLRKAAAEIVSGHDVKPPN